MFPFSQTSDDELNYLTLGIDEYLVDLYSNWSSLNFKPFRFTDNKEYLSMSSLFYTEEQFKHKFAVSNEGSASFSIIHFNCRSLATNFNKLKDSI